MEELDESGDSLFLFFFFFFILFEIIYLFVLLLNEFVPSHSQVVADFVVCHVDVVGVADSSLTARRRAAACAIRCSAARAATTTTRT
jgi:hypothetical protein